ncbi:MAG: carboxypeptidase regulatory-like domain-containing protein [Planctomycetota bacterium]
MTPTSPARDGARTPRKLLALLAAVLVAAIALFLVLDDSTSHEPSTDVAQARDEVGDAAAAELASEGSATRTNVDAIVEGVPVGDGPAVSDARSELRGRVVDRRDAPVPGATVELRRGELTSFSVLDLDVSRARDVVARAVSDANGEFRFALERGVAVDVHAEAPGLEPGDAWRRFAGEYVEVRLASGFRVHGRVTRASDSSPVADAGLRVFQLGGSGPQERRARTEIDGTFDLRVPYDERVVLEVVPLVERSSDWILLEFDESGEAHQDVVVEQGVVVTGTVTSATDGLPIAGAIVGEGWVYRRTATTDTNGEYRLPGFGAPGLNELYAKASGFGQAQVESPPAAVDGALRVDFVLVPARRAHGRVVARDGSPLEGVLVAAVASEDGPEGQRIDWKWDRTDADGRFEVRDLSRELRHALMLSKRGFATRVYDFPNSDFRDEDLDLGTFELGPPALVAGVVQSSDGSGVADVDVSLKGWNADRDRLSRNKSRVGDFYVDTRRTTTDASGRFSFGDVAEGEYQLLARSRAHPDIDPVAVSVSEGEQRDDIVIALAGGESISGRVVDPDGDPVVDVFLNAYVVELRDPSGAEARRIPNARTGADGRFELAALPPGIYGVAVQAASSRSGEPLLGTMVERVDSGSTDLEIRLERGATISGVVRDTEGNLLSNWRMYAHGADGARSGTRTDANGAFRFTVRPGELFDIEVQAPTPSPSGPVVVVAGGGAAGRTIVARGVEAGTQDLELVMP